MASRILGVGITGTSLTELERNILRDTPPYAVVLFGRNVESVEQLSALVKEIKSLSSRPPLIMIDEEGGRVDRLRNLIPGLPAAESFGNNKDAKDLVRWFGNIIGKSLRYFGIDINLAPVVDLKYENGAKGLERRCFGADPETVIWLAGAFMKGQHRAGVASCLKHFPGIGMGNADTHYAASVIDKSLEKLTAEDLGPYFKLANQAKGVMIGHAIYPQIDDHTPASLSSELSTRVLREVVGFEGAAFSDDMEMHAVSDLGTYEQIAERALFAGNDVILFCSHIERIPDLMNYFETRIAADTEFAYRFDDALARAILFRAHCQKLQRRASPPIENFEDVREEVRQFCEEFTKSVAGEKITIPTNERRHVGRSKGTGGSGREEWT